MDKNQTSKRKKDEVRHNIKFNIEDGKQKAAHYILTKADRKQAKFIAMVIDDYLFRLGILDIEKLTDKDIEALIRGSYGIGRTSDTQMLMNQFLMTMQQYQIMGMQNIMASQPNIFQNSAPGTTEEKMVQEINADSPNLESGAPGTTLKKEVLSEDMIEDECFDSEPEEIEDVDDDDDETDINSQLLSGLNAFTN